MRWLRKLKSNIKKMYKNIHTKTSSEFYKKIRPEYFSDSKEEQEIILPRETLAYELSLLSTNMKQDLFETLARKMSEILISPNLIPQTWPTWWWDWKTDSESYTVSEVISDRWFVVDNWCVKNENWAFAISVKSDWKPKIKSDVKKIVETNRWYTKIYFITNQLVSSRNKKEVQDELKNQYKVEVIILDWEWVLDKVYSNNLINLIVDSLNLSIHYKTTKIIWKNDTTRKEELEKLEKDIQNTNRYFEYDIQLVVDSLESALYSRMLELPKDEVIWKFERTKRFNKKVKNRKLEIKISYQLSWTYFMYYSDYDAFLDEFNIFKEYFNENEVYDIWDIELYNNLITLLNWLSSQINLPERWIDINLVNTNFIKLLDCFECKDEKYNCSYLLANFFKSNLLIINWLKDWINVIPFINTLIFIIDKSQNLLDFPFQIFKDMTNVLWDILIDSKEFDILIDKIAEIDSIRNSEKSWGKTFLERWIQKINWWNYKSSLVYFWKSVSKLAKDESKNDMYFSLIWLSISYLELWLNYSYYNSIIWALYLKLKDFFDWWKINNSVIVILKEIIKNEILLWRISYLLIYAELYQILSTQTLDESKENREKFLSEIDLFLSIRLLKSDINNVIKYWFLPDLFDEYWFFISKNTVNYLFWNIDLLDEEFLQLKSNWDDVNDLFNKMKDQPISKQFIWKTNFQDKNEPLLETKLLWVNFFVKNTNNILLSEQLLAFLEWFFATSLWEVIGKTTTIELNINLTDSEDLYTIESKLNLHTYNINLNKNLDNIWETFYNVIVYIFANSFIVNNLEDFMSNLFKTEEVLERTSIILNHIIFAKHILWNNPKLTINDWDKSNYKKYSTISKFQKSNEDHINIDKISNPIRHDNIVISNIINLGLWDKAGWNSFGIVSQPATWTYWVLFWFNSKDYAKRIISEWIDLIGNDDTDNLIRISIIKWIDKDNLNNYRVSITSNFNQKISWWFLQMVSRNHTMTPLNSDNLNMLEWLYKWKKEFYIHFWFYDIITWTQEILEWLYIKKTELIIKNVWEITKNDIEIASIFETDNPVIPYWVENEDLLKKINWTLFDKHKINHA